MHRRDFLLRSSALGAATFATPLLRAQTWPERPIKIYQGFAVGGNGDAISRLIGVEIGKALGQSIVSEAQSGAGGTIASTTVARAKPDGYTLLLATAGHTVAAALSNSPPYQAVASYEMVSTITYFPFLIVVGADSPHKSLLDLLAAAKAKPEAVKFASAGVGSTHHLAGELLASLTGTRMLHIPYRGVAAALPAVMAGDVDFLPTPAAGALGNIQAGKLRVLAVASPTRWAAMPAVPTAIEQGIKDYDVRSWAGLMAPAGTPRSIVERLNVEVVKAVALPAMRARLEEMGGEARSSTPAEMRDMVAADFQRWTRVVADAKIPKQ